MDGSAARDYLADDFDLQGLDYEPEEDIDYSAFANYLRSLSGGDPRMFELAVTLRPFLEDDEGLDGTLYPDGDAIRMMDRHIPGDLLSHEDYLRTFMSLLAQDHRRWTAHRAQQGAQAVWTLESGRPVVDVCLRHVEVFGTSEPAMFADWPDYLTRTTLAERRKMCTGRTNRVNERIQVRASDEPRVTGDDIWQLVETAEGRCVHCGSLCLQSPPHDPVTGKKLPWGYIGRRIGSVTHLVRSADGGSNGLSNLTWSCLWCNDWRCERVVGATDHGGIVRS